MPDAPYRADPPQPEATKELARLAAEGQSRILQASAAPAKIEEKKRRAGERHVRVALGGHHGAPVRTASYVLIGVAALASVGALLWGAGMLWLGLPLLIGALAVRWYAPPKATLAQVARERAWVASLPFALEGYFDVLAGEPQLSCHLSVTLAWNEARLAPSEDVVRAVFGVLDTGTRVESRDGAAVIRSSLLSGRTWIQLEDGPLSRNTKIVAYVHSLVDKVLLPLHRSCAIARVSLTRA